MLRQCAWCLRLIDLAGKRLSAQPLPKLYEASHGMCSVCGTLWMEQVLSSLTPQAPSLYLEEYSNQECESLSHDVSSTQYTIDLSLRGQEIKTVPIVCESSNEYLPSVGYSLSEEPESRLDDDILASDLTNITHQSHP